MTDNNISDNTPEINPENQDENNKKIIINFGNAAQGNAGVFYDTLGDHNSDPFVSQDPPFTNHDQLTNVNQEIDTQSNSEENQN